MTIVDLNVIISKKLLILSTIFFKISNGKAVIMKKLIIVLSVFALISVALDVFLKIKRANKQ